MTRILLLVDDRRVSRMMIKTIVLALNPGWQVLEAENSQETLELTRSQTFDIAIVHLHGSYENGMKTVEELVLKHPQSDYVLVTETADDVPSARARSLGLATLEKPVTEEKIKAFLESC